MAKSTPTLTNFTAGEFSPRLEGRFDIEKYYNSASTIHNFTVQTYGGVQKRPGTRYIAAIKTQTGSNSGARLIPFVFSKTQAYIIEFGHNYIRFFKDEGQIYSSGSTPYEVSTSYTAAQLDDLQYVQSADVLYIVHPEHAPRKLTRTAHTTWTITDVTISDGPYLYPNTNGVVGYDGSAVTLTAAATSGTGVNITASASTFYSTDVGRKIRLKHVDGTTVTWGCATVTSYTSATVVVVTINNNFGATDATSEWRLGTFYTGNYPSKVTFFEERLFYANTDLQPSTVYGSNSGDFDNFAPSGTDGTVTDANGVTYTISSDQVNEITAIYGGRYLHVFSKDGTFNIASGSATAALTPTSVQAVNETKDGASSARISPASKSVLYVGKNKKKVREFAYNIDYDSYTSPDMTIFSEHLGYGGIEEMQFATYPNNILWARKADGTLLGLTYYRDQDVVAWHRHTIAGTNAKVKSLAIIPGVNDAHDTIYLIVERTINGATKQYVEFIEEDYREDDGHTKDDQYFVDSGLTYSGSSATTISGLDHLEGQTVAVLNNGAVESNKTVSSGAITLTNATTKCHIGLPYVAELETQNLEPKTEYGTSQGKKSRIDKAVLRLFETVNLKIGPSSTNVESVLFRDTIDPTGPISPQTKDYEVYISGTYDKNNRLYVVSDAATACTINAIILYMSTYK